MAAKKTAATPRPPAAGSGPDFTNGELNAIYAMTRQVPVRLGSQTHALLLSIQRKCVAVLQPPKKPPKKPAGRKTE